ncbi:hypothetical protein RvY_03659 [Ramazzottius varieornatus]|uniref:Uncharacterized protein n=1 Tax=Ramazzottius varieornatus TaxID=947166 RepID=A0A1D1UPM9_RAMVA|nr:hypothetical protein RvY_03659 [Ramazzottius varieornatus]
MYVIECRHHDGDTPHLFEVANNYFTLITYISGVDNTLADAVSRFDNGRFFENHPKADTEPIMADNILDCLREIMLEPGNFSNSMQDRESSSLKAGLFGSLIPRHDQLMLWSAFTMAFYGMLRVSDFRIGAASTASKAGCSMEQIRAMGRWSSNVSNRYVRPDMVSSTQTMLRISG